MTNIKPLVLDAKIVLLIVGIVHFCTLLTFDNLILQFFVTRISSKKTLVSDDKIVSLVRGIVHFCTRLTFDNFILQFFVTRVVHFQMAFFLLDSLVHHSEP